MAVVKLQISLPYSRIAIPELRWAEHEWHMGDERILKQLLYGELGATGGRASTRGAENAFQHFKGFKRLKR